MGVPALTCFLNFVHGDENPHGGSLANSKLLAAVPQDGFGKNNVAMVQSNASKR